MSDQARFFVLVFVCFFGIPFAALMFGALFGIVEERVARRRPARSDAPAAEPPALPAVRAPRPLPPERQATRREIAERVARHYRNGRWN